MSVLAAALFGVSVSLITLSVWPRGKPRTELSFVEDPRVPRTLH